MPIVVHIKNSHLATGTLINRDRIKPQIKRVANTSRNFSMPISMPVKVRGVKDILLGEKLLPKRSHTVRGPANKPYETVAARSSEPMGASFDSLLIHLLTLRGASSSLGLDPAAESQLFHSRKK